MKIIIPIALCLCLFILISQVAPAKILAMFNSGTKSHKIAFDPLLTELANRGHQLTVFASHITMKKPLPKNLQEIIGPTIDDMIAEMVENGDLPNAFEMRLLVKQANPSILWKIISICEVYYTLPELHSLLNETFDLVMMDPILSECSYAVMDHFNTSKIFLSSMPTSFWIASAFGTPTLPSFVPAIFARTTYSNMSFWDRLKNTALHLLTQAAMDYYIVPQFEAVVKKKLPNARSAQEIKSDVNLVIENTHVSLSVKRPVTPDIIDAGGMHCRSPQPLPKDLQAFADGAGSDGFIVFSIGTSGQELRMPKQLREIFVNAFSRLNVKVLWKWPNETMEGLSSNVKLSSWLPQQDVLGHPNCKLFLTHGGLLSIHEAVHHGVPMLGFPMFADQDANLLQSTEQGFAMWLELATLTEEQLIKTITMMLKESKFRDTVKKYSALYKDNLVNPLDKAVFWVEYVLRHKGAPHLKSAGRTLNFIQFYSLDTLAILLATLLVIIYMIYLVLKVVFLQLKSFLEFYNKKSKLD